MISTPEKILDTAERLFAERGLDGASLRDITSAAGVNIAAVNYHFQSKEALIHAVFHRRMQPVTEQRFAMLDECLKKAGGGRPAIEQILEAFARPVFEMALRQVPGGQRVAGLLIGRMHSQPRQFIDGIFEKELRETAQRFTAALRKAMPERSPADLFWGLHFVVGMLAHSLAAPQILEAISRGKCNAQDPRTATDQFVRFAAAGLRAEAQ